MCKTLLFDSHLLQLFFLLKTLVKTKYPGYLKTLQNKKTPQTTTRTNKHQTIYN